MATLDACTGRLASAVVLVLAAAASQACVRARVEAVATGAEASGHTDAALTLGGHAVDLASCGSGDRAYFLGVDLADRAGETVVRVAIDAVDGPRLLVRATIDGAMVHERLDATRCPGLAARVTPTGWRVNHVRDVSGTVDAECTTAGGRPLVLHARFSHCH